jgi:hypothetical protein
MEIQTETYQIQNAKCKVGFGIRDSEYRILSGKRKSGVVPKPNAAHSFHKEKQNT